VLSYRHTYGYDSHTEDEPAVQEDVGNSMLDLFDRPILDNLDHLGFLILLVFLLLFGVKQFKASRFAVGLSCVFLPIAYFSFTFFYFTGKFLEGRSDQYVDWRDNWAFGLTSLLSASLLLLPIIGFVFLYGKFIEWCGAKAVLAGKSKSGFMVLAALFPLITWIILLIMAPAKLKKDE
jgi:hypothetical protein